MPSLSKRAKLRQVRREKELKGRKNKGLSRQGKKR